MLNSNLLLRDCPMDRDGSFEWILPKSMLPSNQPHSAWNGPYWMNATIDEEPLISVAAATLPSGKIVAWSAYSKMQFGGTSGKTWTAIFDPDTLKAPTRLVDIGHDMFCPGISVLSDGRVMITGGSNHVETTFYDPQKDLWVRGSRMNIGRAYQGQAVLSNGSVLTIGGSWPNKRSARYAELWERGSWRRLSTDIDPVRLSTSSDPFPVKRDYYFWLFQAPNGLVFHAGPKRQMHWIDVQTETMQDSVVRLDDIDAPNGNAVMYDIGKILTLGGSLYWNDAIGSRRTYTIDISGAVGSEKVERVGNMNFFRTLPNSVVLPNGHVVAVGGQYESRLFEDADPVMAAEIWDPQTGQWTVLANMTVPRTYHSVAVLMHDGRVWAAGGGLCGSFCAGGEGANHPDAEIFTPPYLFNDDGTLATRPKVESFTPSELITGQTSTMQVMMDTEAAHTFSLVRLNSVTHATNLDNRRIPLVVASQEGSTFNLDVPMNQHVLLLGTYFLFAMNTQGTPSVGIPVTVATGDAELDIASVISTIESDGNCIEASPNTVDISLVENDCIDRLSSQAFTFERVDMSNTKYRIRAGSSGQCAQVLQEVAGEGAAVVQGSCGDTDYQLWWITGEAGQVQIRSVYQNNLCVTAGGFINATVDLQLCGTAGDLWEVDEDLVLSDFAAIGVTLPSEPTGMISSISSDGNCIDIVSASLVEDACVQGSSGQTYAFEIVEEGNTRLRIRSETNQCLQVPPDNAGMGSTVSLGPCDDTHYQTWWLTGDPGQVQIRLSHQVDLCITADGTMTSPVKLETCDSETDVWTVYVDLVLTELAAIGVADPVIPAITSTIESIYNKCIDVMSAAGYTGLVEDDCAFDDSNQTYTFELVDSMDTRYRILVGSTGQCAQAPQEGMLIGAPIVHGVCEDTDYQTWLLTGDPGLVQIRSVIMYNLCFTANGTIESPVELQMCGSEENADIWSVATDIILTDLASLLSPTPSPTYLQLLS